MAIVDPRRTMLRRRTTSESSPSVAAIFSMCSSAAKSVCGAPNPRNAPFGGVWVATALARTRTFGQVYGPVACSAPRDSTTGDSVT